jgi:hypothetical protein
MHILTLTLLVPEMWIAPGAGQDFTTIAIVTNKDEPLTGRIGFAAEREVYVPIELKGEGKLIEA